VSASAVINIARLSASFFETCPWAIGQSRCDLNGDKEDKMASMLILSISRSITSLKIYAAVVMAKLMVKMVDNGNSCGIPLLTIDAPMNVAQEKLKMANARERMQRA